MNKWKNQSSAAIKKLFAVEFPTYWATIDPDNPVWQPKSQDHFYNRKTTLTSTYRMYYRDSFCPEFCADREVSVLIS